MSGMEAIGLILTGGISAGLAVWVAYNLGKQAITGELSHDRWCMSERCHQHEQWDLDVEALHREG